MCGLRCKGFSVHLVLGDRGRVSIAPDVYLFCFMEDMFLFDLPVFNMDYGFVHDVKWLIHN